MDVQSASFQEKSAIQTPLGPIQIATANNREGILDELCNSGTFKQHGGAGWGLNQGRTHITANEITGLTVGDRAN